MLYPRIEDCLKNTHNSKFALVIMTSKRLKEYSSKNQEQKLTTILKEIADNRISIK